MTETDNFKLKKPDGADRVDVSDINLNTDKIDKQLKRLSPTVTITGTTISVTDATGPYWKITNNTDNTVTITHTEPIAYSEDIEAGKTLTIDSAVTDAMSIAFTATDTVTFEYFKHLPAVLTEIAEGGVGTIETIKVNGTALHITNKAVNITVPTKTSDITNDSNFISDSNYVHTDNNFTNTRKSNYNAAYTHSQSAHAPSNAQKNIIESIKVNGITQSISNKYVNITVPTKISEVTNDSDFTTNTKLKNHENYTGTWVDKTSQAKSMMTENGYVYADSSNLDTFGIINTNSSQKLLPYFNVSGCYKLIYGRIKTTTSSVTYGLVFYNENFEPISGEVAIRGTTSGIEDTEILVPEGAVYIRTSCSQLNMPNFKIVLIYKGILNSEIDELSAQLLDLQLMMLEQAERE